MSNFRISLTLGSGLPEGEASGVPPAAPLPPSGTCRAHEASRIKNEFFIFHISVADFNHEILGSHQPLYFTLYLKSFRSSFFCAEVGSGKRPLQAPDFYLKRG